MTSTLARMEHYFDTIPGFFWFEECYRRLLATLPDDRPSRFVEIGSFQGRSTAWLGLEILKSRKPVTLYAVDSFVAWKGVPQGESLRALFDTHTAPIRVALGDQFRVIPFSSLEAAELFDDESLDVVFVDGDHEYEAVMADISAWWPKLKVGGFMAGDDFNMAPVCRAVCEHFAPSGYILCHGWTTNPEPQCWPSWLARKA